MADLGSLQTVDISNKSNELDSFGRLRVANPEVLFESFFTYDLQATRWTQLLVGSGTVTRNANETTAELAVTSASGDSVIRQTRRYIPYQAGRSQHYSLSAVFSPAKTNLRQRLGAFDATDGIFLELDGTTLSVVNRSSISGSTSDARKVSQSSWNLDKLDGLGESRQTLDITKIQLFIIDYGWQAAGTVRCGFLLGGEVVYFHMFENANILNVPYMKRGGLPVRMEITNTGATSGASTFKGVCFMVASESGFNSSGVIRSASQGTTLKSINTTLTPLISLRLNSTALKHTFQLLSHSLILSGNTDLELVVVKNSTLTGASFVAVATESMLEVDSSATALTGGVVIHREYTSQGGSAAGGSIRRSDIYDNLSAHFGSFLDGTSEIVTLAARTLSSSANAAGALSWREFP